MIVCLILSFYMITGGGIHQNVIMCVANGNISVEQYLNNCCDEVKTGLFQTNAQYPALADIGGYNSCGQCIDYPVVKDILRGKIVSKTDKTLGDEFASSATTLIAFSVVPQQFAEKFQFFKQPESIDTTLQSLRTVVLLS